MSTAETLVILILGAIAYQLYLLLKIANKQTETFASEEHSTLYSVFTPRQIQWEHDQWKRAQKQLEGGSKYEALEHEELLAFRSAGKPIAEFKPSSKLLAMIRLESERITAVNQHFANKEKMLEANIAALNGTPIKAARDVGLKYSYSPAATFEAHFNTDLARRREYWEKIYDTVTGKEPYASNEQ